MPALQTLRDAEAVRISHTTSTFRTYDNKATSDGLGTYGKPSPSGIGAVKSIGSPVLPVLLVEFSDIKFQETSTPEKFHRQLNEEGYSDVDYQHGRTTFTSKGSVRDYFVHQSNGLFSPTFEVVGKVTLNQTQGYYFRDEGERRDVNTYQFFRDAITKAQNEGIDFSKYVVSGNPSTYTGAPVDGVPMVSFICAGYSEAAVGYNLYYYGKDETGLDQPWPHFSRLANESSTAFGRVYGDTRFMSYFLGCELTGIIDWTQDEQGEDKIFIGHSHFAGPGTFVHEFGHAIGLPDFYAVGTQQQVKTPQYWSMMDKGAYYNEGYNLVGYTAYELALLGWLKYTTLGNEAQRCELYKFNAPDAPEGAATAYVIKNPSNAKEYYMLENRRADDIFYPKNMGSGMLVYHIYFDYNLWESNQVNASVTTPRYTVVPADGKWQDEISGTNYKNDLFPGVSGIITKLTDDSTPQAAIAYSGTTKRMRRPLYNIRKDGEVIRFDYLTDFEAEGISAVTIEQEPSSSMIDLQGRVLSTTSARNQQPGLYIQGGKKKLVH